MASQFYRRKTSEIILESYGRTSSLRGQTLSPDLPASLGRDILKSSARLLVYESSNLPIVNPFNVREEDEKAVVAATFLRAALRPLGGDEENGGRRGWGSRAREPGFFARNHGESITRASRFARITQNVACGYKCVFLSNILNNCSIKLQHFSNALREKKMVAIISYWFSYIRWNYIFIIYM